MKELPTSIRAVVIPEFGDPEVMRVAELPMPAVGPSEVLVRVAAAGVNRGDMVQRQGHYPPPAGVTDVPGLEVSGTIVACGELVQRWRIGDEVCALLAGGGYATYCIVPAEQCFPIPTGVSLIDAASLPETYCTVWDAVWIQGRLSPGETLLVHGGASGIGVTAIQLAVAFNNPIFVTAGSAEKCDACTTLGATNTINYREADFADVVRTQTGGRGVDLVLDIIGGDYLPRNISCLAPEGRHISLGLQGGIEASLNLREVMRRRLTLIGTTLRGRDSAYKSRLCSEVESKLWPLFGLQKLRPIVARRFSLDEVVASHRYMESGANIGKILLVP